MKISQREARRLKKRVAELEEQAATMRQNWLRPYKGVALYNWAVEKDRWYGMVEGAIACGKLIVVRIDSVGKYQFYAC